MFEIQIFLIAFISSFVGLLIPWVASALSVSTLILTGLPVQLAKTTYQLGNIGINLGALVPLLKSQKLRKDLIYPMILIALIGGYLGGKLLINIPNDLLLKLTWAFMIILLLINIFSKWLGVLSWEISKRRKIWGFISYFFLNVFFAIFPMGTGILFQFSHTFFFRVTNLESRLMGCFLTMPFMIWFLFPVIESWVYNLVYAIIFGVWGYFGGYLWAHSGIKLGNSWLKKLLMGWLFLLGIYFLFFA
jgi:uncharacterized membrane protein YfcA